MNEWQTGERACCGVTDCYICWVGYAYNRNLLLHCLSCIHICSEVLLLGNLWAGESWGVYNSWGVQLRGGWDGPVGRALGWWAGKGVHVSGTGGELGWRWSCGGGGAGVRRRVNRDRFCDLVEVGWFGVRVLCLLENLQNLLHIWCNTGHCLLRLIPGFQLQYSFIIKPANLAFICNFTAVFEFCAVLWQSE